MNVRLTLRALTAAAFLVAFTQLPGTPARAATPGGLFVTGHDPDAHAVVGPQAPAEHLTQVAIGYVTSGKSSPRILLVTDLRNPGGDQADSRIGLANSGFHSFDVADYGSGTAGVLDLHTVPFPAYDAIVVASDFGGWLRQDELDILISRQSELWSFVNHGGGLVVFDECACAYPRAWTRPYGFLPFLHSAAGWVPWVHLNDAGLAIGMLPTDSSQGNAHSEFSSAAGLAVLDQSPWDGRPITLATRGQFIGATGPGAAPPQITYQGRNPGPNANGWNNTAVTLTWSCIQTSANLLSPTATVTLSHEGAGQSATGTCSDVNGQSVTNTQTGVNIDLTPPVISFSGNAGEYTVDQTVQITCSATDALSGVASSNCPSLNAPAYTFPTGTTTLTANATDKAGNTGTGSASFTVRTSFQGLCGLVRRLVGDAGVADSLCAKLTAAEASAARGDSNALAGQMGAFANEVEAQTGKAISAENAALLLRLAGELYTPSSSPAPTGGGGGGNGKGRHVEENPTAPGLLA